MNKIFFTFIDAATGVAQFTQERLYFGEDPPGPPDPPAGMLVVDGAPPTSDPARWNGSAWASVDADIEHLARDKWESIKAERAAREFGQFEWDGSTFDADESAQRRLIGAAAGSIASDVRWLAGCVQLIASSLGVQLPDRPTMQVPWTLADNTTRALDKDDAVDAGLALLTRVATIFAQSAALRSAINSAQTEEQLEAISLPPPP
jgi:hypothetical protein